MKPHTREIYPYFAVELHRLPFGLLSRPIRESGTNASTPLLTNTIRRWG